jgi:transglutaminase-like putative cysteine protease
MSAFSRRTMCFGCVAIAAAALLMASRMASSDDAAAAPGKRTFKFTYAVKIPAPAEGSRVLEAWVPVAPSDDLQQVSDLKVECSVPHTLETEAEYGNQMVHVKVANPTAEVTLSWSATIARTADVGQGKGPMHPRFLQPDNLVPLTGKATELATELGVKGDGPARARARKIYENVLHTMAYDKVAEGWGKGDFDRACIVGKGNCTDFHAKFIGVARAAGMPVRFTMGVPLSTEAKGTASGYHCWAHFHDGTSWIPVDISEAQKVLATEPAKAEWFFGNLDPDRLSLTVGRDLTLAPKQQGPALLFFAYPYVEVDGKKTDVPKENRSFTFENVGG